MKTFVSLSAGALLVLLALVACSQSQEDKAAAPATSKEVPDPAAAHKAFPTLQTVTVDGQPYDLAQQRGHWVVVNFWATWCKPCLQEMPALSEMAKADKDTLRVIGLAYDEIEDADLLAFLRENPVDYPIAKVDVYEPPADFETPRGLPMTYLIAPDGRLVERFLGPVTPAQIRQSMHAAPLASNSD